MMKKLLLIILINFLAFAGQDSVKVEINVSALNIEDSSSVFIAGNDIKLGNWDPGKVKLIKVNDSLWQHTFYFSTGTNLQFKFTKGTWDKEAVSSKGKVPPNNIIDLEKDTSFHIRITNWRDEFPSGLTGQITGEVEYHNNFLGKNIENRNIVVWLPPSYSLNIEEKYPVLYMQDGQNLFDPKTSSFGVDWRLDETADSLIKSGDINEIIIVGIYNTPLRTSEYTQNDTGKAYMEFVVKELKPFIDKNYRTYPDRKNTAVGGSSAGGLVSFMLAWEYPEIFSKAACLSSAFKIENINYVDDVEKTQSKKDIIFYIDNGGVGIEKRIQPGVDEMITALINKGYKLGDDLIYFLDENAEHFESYWAKRTYKFLKLFFGKQIK